MSAEKPRRCRGPLQDDRTYAGCPFGSGDALPLSADYDCPVCHGSGFEGVVATTIPHESVGDPECCGCLKAIIRGEQADIVCNECGAVVRTVPAADLQHTLARIELTLDMTSVVCPHCGSVNLFPGFAHMDAYICPHCDDVCQREK